MAEFNAPLTLLTAALRALACGYSLIPLRAKQPALAWSVFQSVKPSSLEVQRWFAQQQHSGLGLVTGRLSRLAVLDFDEEALVHQFLAQHPDLAQTQVVTSAGRGLPHFYYRLPPHTHVPSRAGQGVDWLAEGRYVVAPPTVIEGKAYEVFLDRLPLQLTHEQIARIEAFVRATQPTAPITVIEQGRGHDTEPLSLSTVALQQRYRQQAGAGRNNALFHNACFARDHGWSQAATITALAELHTHQPAAGEHKPETPTQRQREARATIASAFARPARPRRAVCNAYNPVSRYPNRARETLLRQPDGAAVLRVLEGALLYGCATDTPVTELELVTTLRHIACRDTVRKALHARSRAGEPFFVPVPPQPPPAASADPDGSKEADNKMLLSPGKNQTNSKSGPKALLYRLPTPDELCALLGVEMSPGDPITRDDVRSSKAYRQALHREFLTRRPGKYFQALLGDRLGVCTRTIRYYHQQIPIHSSPSWHETPLFWFNLDLIPAQSDLERFQIDTGGQCLVDETGQRWPLKREIAAQLLKQGRRVSRLQRGPNTYWYGDPPPPTMPIAPIPATARQDRAGRPSDAPVFASEGASTAFYGAGGIFPPPALAKRLETPETVFPPTARPDHSGAGQGSTEAEPLSPPVPAQEGPVCASEGASTGFYGAAGGNTPAQPEKRLKTPLLPPDERLAQWIHRDLPTFSLSNARRLVECYGVEVVEASWKRLWWLDKKGMLRNPAGFLVIASRVEWRERHGFGQPAPEIKWSSRIPK